MGPLRELFHNVSQEFELWPEKLTLTQIGFQLVLSQQLKHHAQVFHLLFLRSGENQDVIKVNTNKLVLSADQISCS